MYRKYRIVESIASNVSQYESYHDQVYRYTPSTKSQHLNVSPFYLQLSLPNPLKPGVKWRMKMQLEQRQQVMLQLHLSDNNFSVY